MYSMYTIAFLGFFVWGHHMYMVGLAHTTRMLFSTLTVMISVPAATKLMHWCVTIANSAFVVELPLIFTLTFIFLFVSGGISGMCVAHTGMDVLFHDTFYVIGHFHVMLAGAAMFGSFGAFYFYFASIFGVKYSRIYSYMHFSYYLCGQLITVAPMFWLGYAGMPRRVLDYPASLGGWHSLISAGHLLSVAGLLSFFIMIFDSLRQGRAALRTTLGINRFNIRLGFYLFEISRLKVVKQKFGYLFNYIFKKMQIHRRRPFAYFEEYESTLITYHFRTRSHFLFFNDFYLCQITLLLTVFYIFFSVSPWSLWICGGIFLSLIGFLGLIANLGIFIGFLWVIDLGVGLIFLIFLSHLMVMGETKLQSNSSRSRKNLPPLLLFFVLFIISPLAVFEESSTSFSGHFRHIKWLNYHLLWGDYEISNLNLLREIFFYNNSWEFILINYFTLFALMGLVIFNFSLTQAHKRSIRNSLLNYHKTQIPSAPLFIRDQNFISQQQTSSATRLWEKRTKPGSRRSKN